MARNYVGIVTSPGNLSINNPNFGVTGVNWGILNTGIVDYDFSRDNLMPYVVSVATSTSSGTLVSSLVFNTPTHTPGDLFLIFLGCAESGRTFSSSGWTVQREFTTNNPSAVVLSKVASNAEPPTQTFSIAGGTARAGGVCISVKNWTNLYVGLFGSQANPPVVPTVSTSGAYNRHLMLFFLTNDGSGRSWDVNSISEYNISLFNSFNPSIDVSGIYNEPTEVLSSYPTTQDGAGANSFGLALIIDNASNPVIDSRIISSSNSPTSNTITLGAVNSGDLIVLFFEHNSAITVPSGFTKIVTSETNSPYMAVATKTATGSETTLTGTWSAAASVVIRGSTSVIGTPQGPSGPATSTAPSITLTQPNSLVFFWTVNNNDHTVLTPPPGWTQVQRANGASKEGYLYFNSFLSTGATGTVSATWSGTPTNSVLVSFV